MPKPVATDPKPKRGRPRVPEGERRQAYSLYLTKEEIAYCNEVGGAHGGRVGGRAIIQRSMNRKGKRSFAK